MSVQLLDKTRKIAKLLHTSATSKVVFDDICAVLAETMSSNVLVLSKRGKVLGQFVLDDGKRLVGLLPDAVGELIDSDLNDRLLAVLSTRENVNPQILGFEGETVIGTYALITPLEIASKRLGTLFVYRYDQPYDIDDIILGEYATTVVAMEIMRSVNEENAEINRKQAVVRSAISTLSYSELEAICCVFNELGNMEGILVASRIAEKSKITRSVIVIALRKFESAGVIESRSSGMKGTYIKVLNDAVYDELKNIRSSTDK